MLRIWPEFIIIINNNNLALLHGNVIIIIFLVKKRKQKNSGKGWRAISSRNKYEKREGFLMVKELLKISTRLLKLIS